MNVNMFETAEDGMYMVMNEATEKIHTILETLRGELIETLGEGDPDVDVVHRTIDDVLVDVVDDLESIKDMVYECFADLQTISPDGE